MSPMTPIETVDDAVRTVAYLGGWSMPSPGSLALARNASAHPVVADLLQRQYEDALRRTEGLVLSRARLLRAWDVLNAHGVLR